MKEIKARLLNWGLLLYFLIPYCIFIFFFGWKFEIDINESIWALRNSLLQAGVAAAIALFMAIPLSQGLLQAKPKVRPWLKLLLLLPQVMPALFSLLVAFTWVRPFPMGSTGIIIVYVLINVGFAAVLLAQAVESKLGNLANVAEVFSVSRSDFTRKIYLPLLKSDLRNIIFLIFAFCLSSFSIPLIAGGGKGTNLEVLIYEKIFLEQNWAKAFSLCLFQTVLVVLIGKLAVAKSSPGGAPFIEGRFLKSKTGLGLLLLYSSFFLGGYAAGLVKSFANFDFFRQYSEDLLPVTLYSLTALSLYLALNFALLAAWLLGFVLNGRFTKAHNLISISTVVVGFSVYLGFPSTREFDLVKIVLAMSFILFPALFKLFLQKPVEGLSRQIEIARLYGVKPAALLVNVIVRQLKGPLMLWLSVLVLWFLSDFAIIRSVGAQRQTLGLLSESFLSSYRLELSYLMSSYIILISVIFISSLYLVLRMVNVIYKKSAF